MERNETMQEVLFTLFQRRYNTQAVLGLQYEMALAIKSKGQKVKADHLERSFEIGKNRIYVSFPKKVNKSSRLFCS